MSYFQVAPQEHLLLSHSHHAVADGPTLIMIVTQFAIGMRLIDQGQELLQPLIAQTTFPDTPHCVALNCGIQSLIIEQLLANTSIMLMVSEAVSGHHSAKIKALSLIISKKCRNKSCDYSLQPSPRKQQAARASDKQALLQVTKNCNHETR
jgi:hypothetical protein